MQILGETDRRNKGEKTDEDFRGKGSMNAAAICGLAISLWTDGLDWYRDRIPAMQGVCESIVIEAIEHGVDPILMAAVGWRESRFNAAAVSHCGAVGPLQVMPRWACPNRTAKGCDLVEAGVVAYKGWLRRHETPTLALCHYNNGTRCYGSGMRYARSVLAHASQLKKKI
jgi:soluble lytic murein transglycosylase-like protein